MQLSDYDDEALRRELERRAQARITPFRPPVLKSSDFTELRKLCADYLTECERGLDTDSDTPHYIFESAMEAIYGRDVFRYIAALSLTDGAR